MAATPEEKAQRAQDTFTRKAALYGSSVFLADGTAFVDSAGNALKAFQDHDVKAVLGGLTGEADAPAKPPLMLYFSAAAAGVLQENMQLLVGPENARRAFRVASPLHPQQVADVVIYVAAVVYPW